MPYCQLHYHLVWATKNRAPLLTEPVRPTLYLELRRKSLELDAVVHAVGGIEDHVHMVVSLPPTMAVATFVGQIKGVSSFKMSRIVRPSRFAWQAEYGAFTIRHQEIDRTVSYVLNQEAHHRNGNVVEDLERW